MAERYFLAIDMSLQTKARIQEVVVPLYAEIPGARWVRRENYHITLVFLGEKDRNYISRLSGMARELATVQAPFVLTLAGWGFFPHSHRPRVMYMKAEEGNEVVVDLARTVQDFVGDGEANFQPHLTVARFKNPKPIQTAEEFLPISTSVRELTLFSSTLTPSGPNYRAVDKFTFSGIARGE